MIEKQINCKNKLNVKLNKLVIHLKIFYKILIVGNNLLIILWKVKHFFIYMMKINSTLWFLNYRMEDI